MTNPFILASASPRRREICAIAGIPVEIVPASAESPLDRTLPLEEAVRLVAKDKAEEVATRFPDRIVIGADTVVAIGSRILGKPRDKADADAMLRLLSGHTHTVCTGVWVCFPGNGAGFTDTAEVDFYPLTEQEIATYIDSGEPMDKAGAYGIQRLGMRFIRGIRGDFYSVVGLPGARLVRFLRKHGFDW